MNVRTFAAGACLALCASFVPSVSATADTKPKEIQSYKDEVEKYKEDFALFRVELQEYEEARRLINTTFKAAMERVMADNRSVETSTKISQFQKRQHAASKRVAVVLATSLRDAAIATLGICPTPPPEPIKPGNTQKNRKAAKQPR